MVTLCTAAAAEANPDPGISQAGAAGIGGGEGRRARLLGKDRLPSRWPKCLGARGPHSRRVVHI